MLKKLKPYFPLLLLVLIGTVLISALFHTGYYATHDGIFHIYRTEEALSMLKLGSFPLRWAGNFDQGFGIPLFTFIYPLPYYLSSVASYFVGSIWAVKLLTLVAYLLGGVGVYYFFKTPKQKFYLPFALALVYLMTPYQFLNIFVRGALGEILALGLIPWVLASFRHLEVTKKLRWYHPLPLGLLLIAHNFLGILFAVFMIGYLLFSTQNKKSAFLSLLLSFGLSAFFIVPMVSQKGYLYSTLHPDLNFRYDQHFVKLNQFIYGKWDYWYSMPPDKEDGMSFQLGVAQITLVSLSLLYTLYDIRHSKKITWYLIFAYLGSLFLMHAKSAFIWELIPILKSIQFPWRFLFMPAILTPLLAFPLLTSLSKKFLPYVLALFLILNFVNIRNYRRPIKFFDLTEYTDLYRLYYNKTSTTFRSEILPRWNVPAERYKSDELLINSGNMTLDSLVYNPLYINFTLNNKPDPAVAKVTLLRNYYPGWHLIMDGKTKVQIDSTDEGMITFEPALGIHSYILRIGSTPIEWGSNLISLISLLSLIYVWRKSNS